MDGWFLYKKNKFNLQPVSRYISLIQDDFNKNKIIVSANLSNLFNTYLSLKYYAQHKKPPTSYNNYFDYDKWC